MKELYKKIKRLCDKTDKRQKGKVKYHYEDILFIIMIASLANADTVLKCIIYAKEKEDFLRQFIKLENGIPSKNTFYRALENIDHCVIQAIMGFVLIKCKTKDNYVSIDGKTLIGSKHRSEDSTGKHVLWAMSSKDMVPIDQVCLKNKSQEKTALPEFIKKLQLKGKIVTIDAVGTYKNISEAIIQQGGDFVLPVKDNQKTLRVQISDYFDINKNLQKLKKDGKYFKKEEVLHSTLETREYYVVNDLSLLPKAKEWEHVKSVGYVKYTTHDDKNSIFERYFICSQDFDAEEFANIVRSHWSIEIMHWYLDVVFKEDKSTISIESSVINMNMIRKMGASLMVRYKKIKKDSMPNLEYMLSLSSEKYINKVFS